MSCPIELRAKSGRPQSSTLVAFLLAALVMFPAGSGGDTRRKEKLEKNGSVAQEGWFLALEKGFLPPIPKKRWVQRMAAAKRAFEV